jgi:hypothetical protein
MENSDPVTDPNLEAKIRAAREILHQEVVTDDDLWRLEREGQFANLSNIAAEGKRVPANAAPPAPPGPNHVTQGPPVPTSAAAANAVPTQSNGPTK